VSKNIIFGIPKNREEFLTFCFIIVVLCGFLVNVYSNGKATLIFIKNKYDISPDSPVYNSTDEYKQIYDLAHQQKYTDDRINWAILFLTCVLLPVICFIYGFFIFKKSDWEVNKI
jgi:ABC-type transport system involved in multi-copper enzyme maturation permease subunit